MTAVLSFLFIVPGPNSCSVPPVAGKWKGPGSGRWELRVLPETVMERPGGGDAPTLAGPAYLRHGGLKAST